VLTKPRTLRFAETTDTDGGGSGPFTNPELEQVKADLAKLQTEHAEAQKSASETAKQLADLQAKAAADKAAHEAAVAEYETKLAAANQAAWKAEAATTHGLKPELVKFLTGTTKEEIDAAAKELATATGLPKPTSPDPSFTQPLVNTPNPSQDTFLVWANANL